MPSHRHHLPGLDAPAGLGAADVGEGLCCLGQCHQGRPSASAAGVRGDPEPKHPAMARALARPLGVAGSPSTAASSESEVRPAALRRDSLKTHALNEKEAAREVAFVALPSVVAASWWKRRAILLQNDPLGRRRRADVLACLAVRTSESSVPASSSLMQLQGMRASVDGVIDRTRTHARDHPPIAEGDLPIACHVIHARGVAEAVQARGCGIRAAVVARGAPGARGRDDGGATPWAKVERVQTIQGGAGLLATPRGEAHTPIARRKSCDGHRKPTACSCSRVMLGVRTDAREGGHRCHVLAEEWRGRVDTGAPPADPHIPPSSFITNPSWG